jgi:hypothetical protein
MELRDDVAAQQFSQSARDRWSYTVRTRAGLSYTVSYVVQPFGYMKEVLKKVLPEGTQVLIWDRDFKIGENVKETWLDRIRQG